ncbi:MAG: hypothetical protein QF752_12390 [Planctomycetota bacterium]|nr:hypothetical protein [Planctomycetota bacterium]
MSTYTKTPMEGLDYDTPVSVKPRKKQPPFVVVMNENCTSCAGTPTCLPLCPVSCIHQIYDEGRPVRVYVDNEICIGCMNCFSDHYRPKNINKGDKSENCEKLNRLDERTKQAVCPWDAIEVQPFDSGVERSSLFYSQPRSVAEEGENEEGDGEGKEGTGSLPETEPGPESSESKSTSEVGPKTGDDKEKSTG